MTGDVEAAMHVALVGPASPRSFADLLDKSASELPAGYARTPVDELARGLLDYGVRVTVVTGGIGSRRVWSARAGLLTVYTVPYRADPKRRVLDNFALERQHLVAVLTEVSPDITHAHWTYEFALAAMRSDRNAVVTAHDAPLTVFRQYRDWYRLYRLFMARRVAHRTKRLAAVSPYLADRWRAEMGWRGAISLLPNIAPRLIDVNEASRTDPAFRVLVLANADPRKNVRTLLRAWPEILRRVPSANLILAGAGLGPTDALAAEAGTTKNVVFLGPLTKPEVARELRHADLLAHPSLEECHPVAVLEAMGAGVPVVAGRDSGGVAWTLNGSGILCDVTKVDEIAESVARVAVDPALRKQLAYLGTQRVLQEFSANKIVETHLAYYEEILRSEGQG